uniref:Pentatricopeptide repeat-containing protein n=1 Tax=Aegilops tauschii subsp. strangulata TaxID=200361 RepID=A0A453PWI4_AEGTS
MEGFVWSRQMDKVVNVMMKALSLMKSCHWRSPVKLVEAIAMFFEEQVNADDASRYIKLLQKFNLISLPMYKSVLQAYVKVDTTLPINFSEMVAIYDMVTDEEMDQLIIHASKIDITGNA